MLNSWHQRLKGNFKIIWQIPLLITQGLEHQPKANMKLIKPSRDKPSAAHRKSLSSPCGTCLPSTIPRKKERRTKWHLRRTKSNSWSSNHSISRRWTSNSKLNNTKLNVIRETSKISNTNITASIDMRTTTRRIRKITWRSLRMIIVECLRPIKWWKLSKWRPTIKECSKTCN